MHETMTQIGKRYGVSARTVGDVLYALNIRDASHETQKGFPYEQAVVHGIAKAFTGRNGETYYRYDLSRVREEFEARLAELNPPEQAVPKDNDAVHVFTEHSPAVTAKLGGMLETLNAVLDGGDCSMLYRLKADIADLYAQCAQRPR